MDDIPDTAGDFDAYYGLLAPAQTVLVRAYGDDGDDRLLAELRPRFVVLFEPALEFVRRVEVFRAGAPGLNVRVYFMVWQLSAEEHKFLAAQRREKNAFERLIKERGVRNVRVHRWLRVLTERIEHAAPDLRGPRTAHGRHAAQDRLLAHGGRATRGRNGAAARDCGHARVPLDAAVAPARGGPARRAGHAHGRRLRAQPRARRRA
jgi:hypothetical protein